MNDRVLAIVIDGKVERVMRFDEETSALLLSNPTIIDVTANQITESWNYDENSGFFVNIDGQTHSISV
jgi:hypothetical protein